MAVEPSAQADVALAVPARAGAGGGARSWRVAGLALARRVVALLALLVAISFGIFALLEIAPGSSIDVLIGPGSNPSPEQVAALEHAYGLDEPFVQRYVDWLGNAVRFDFGDSVQSRQDVGTLLTQRLAVTAELIGLSALIAILGGIMLGAVAALRRGRPIDRGLTMLGLTGISTPAFVSGLLLLYVLSVVLDVFPSGGDGSGAGDRLWHLILPACALAFTTLGFVMRLTRASLRRTLEQDYIAFAQARGLPRRVVLVRYAMRNALIPLLTASGLVVTSLLTSTVLVEVTFNITGIGSLLVSAVETRDVPVVQGIAMTIAFAVVLTNIIVEVLYVVADPRIGAGR